jgi:hypothetical protein
VEVLVIYTQTWMKTMSAMIVEKIKKSSMDTIYWIGIIISGVLGGFFSTDDEERPGNIVVGAFFGLIISFVAGFIVAEVINGKIPSVYVEYVSGDKRNLSSFKDNMSSQISGSFFLGIGSFSGGGSVYYGYEDLGESRYKQVKFNPEYSVIVEDIDSTETPYFVEIWERLTDSVYNERLKWDGWMMGPYREKSFKRWEIHIPKGSILQTFELNLE